MIKRDFAIDMLHITFFFVSINRDIAELFYKFLELQLDFIALTSYYVRNVGMSINVALTISSYLNTVNVHVKIIKVPMHIILVNNVRYVDANVFNTLRNHKL